MSTAKAKHDKEDDRTMKILDTEIAKSDARKATKATEEKHIKTEDIAQQWATKEYSLRMLAAKLTVSMVFLLGLREEKSLIYGSWYFYNAMGIEVGDEDLVGLLYTSV